MPTIDEHALVDEIKNLLLSGGNPLADEIASLAADYIQLCNEANTRLRECNKLLRKGLRGEALQKCDIEPNLLDLVATLDFPERRQWCEFLKRSGELQPPELLIEVAAELNEAYAADMPLTGMLQQHRLLALGRGPLPMRISLLRRIAKADPTNPVWNEDLRKYEQARLQTIHQELTAAARAADIEAVEAIEQEVMAPGWLEQPPEPLVQKVRQTMDRLRVDKARAELVQLEPQLAAAHSALDAERGRVLRARWQACVALADLDDADPLAVMVAPTLAWLADQDRQEQRQAAFAAAVARLEKALDGEPPKLELERLAHDALRHDLPLPPLVEHRLRERLRSLDLTASRRRTLIAAGCVVAVLMVGGLTTLGIRLKLHNDEVALRSAEIEKLMNDGEPGRAEEYIEKLKQSSPAVAASAPIEAAVLRIGKLKEDEAARQQAFARALAESEMLAQLDKPTLESLTKADKHLRDTTTPLARLTPEQTQLAELRDRLSKTRKQVQQKIDDEFTARLQALTNRLVALEEAAKKADPSDEEVRAVHKESLELAGKAGEASASLLANVAPLKTRAEALLEDVGKREERSRLLRRVTEAVGDPDRYVAALKAFAEKFSTSARAVHFQQVVKEAPCWQALARWNELAAHWNQADLATIRGPAAQELVAESKAFVDDPAHAGIGDQSRLADKLKFLDTASARAANEQMIMKQLHELLTNPTIAGLRLLKVRDTTGIARFYYLRESPVLNQATNKVNFKYLSDYELNEKGASVTKDQLVQSAPPYDAVAPQSKVAREILDLVVTKLESLGWEAVFIDCIDRVHKESDLDPVLKLIIFDKLLETGSSGSLVLRNAFGRSREIIAAANLSLTVNWLNPDDVEARRERIKAQELFGRLPDIRKLEQAVRDEMTALKAPFSLTYRWVGWLAQDESADDKWICTTATKHFESGELVVVYQPAVEKALKFETVGKLEQGAPVITARQGPALVEGRPIYQVTRPLAGK